MKIFIHILVFIFSALFFIFIPNIKDEWFGYALVLQIAWAFLSYGIYLLKGRDIYEEKLEKGLPQSNPQDLPDSDKAINVGIYSFIIIFILLTLFWGIIEPSTLNLSEQGNWVTVFVDIFFSLVISIVIYAIYLAVKNHAFNKK